ncbi:PIH1 domain-containing protein 1 [Anabrus simplex]|uniref:PIH1 domain-containing protein 1 n=1 Tax=Anabrus simplex TaxID=316456 RepID=UPI0035A2CE94
MSEKRNSVLLDVDKSILENKLMLEENKEEDLESLLPFLQAYEEGKVPGKLVQPTQGMCIKTRTTEGDKVFVNICQTEDIPSPELLDDEALLRLWSSDEAGDYRIPMSIGDGHQEPDKAGNPAMAYDVAISSEFFKKVETNRLYLKFLIAIVLEAVQDKFKLELDIEDYTILKNRKAMGKLQMHRIRQRNPEEQSKKPLIEELSSSSSASKGSVANSSKKAETTKKPTSELPLTGSSMPSRDRQPEYRVWQQPAEGDPQLLVAELKMEEVLGARELSLDVGEDRIIVESRRHGYLLDVFVPHSIDQENTSAHFNRDSRILTVTMPVLAVN